MVGRFAVAPIVGRGRAIVAAWGGVAQAPAAIKDTAIHNLEFVITNSVAAILCSSQNSVLK
jgi:hypothetical protein